MEIHHDQPSTTAAAANDPPSRGDTGILPTRKPKYTSKLKARWCPNFQWYGVKPLPLLFAVAIGLILRFAIPKPTQIPTRGWTLLAVFTSTITGLIFAPLPVGAWAFVCLTVALITKTLSFEEAFSAMTSDVIWLIVVAFFFSRGFVKTGLGDRFATYFVMWLGKKTIGLSYGLVLSETLVSPAIPSTTARAGGVFSPVIVSVALNNGSLPFDKKSSRKIGSYLFMSQFQVLF